MPLLIQFTSSQMVWFMLPNNDWMDPHKMQIFNFLSV